MTGYGCHRAPVLGVGVTRKNFLHPADKETGADASNSEGKEWFEGHQGFLFWVPNLRTVLQGLGLGEKTMLGSPRFGELALLNFNRFLPPIPNLIGRSLNRCTLTSCRFKILCPWVLRVQGFRVRGFKVWGLRLYGWRL